MTYEEMKSIVNAQVEDTVCVGLENIKSTSDLVEDLGADELDVVEIIISLEEAFGINIEEEDCEKMHTVGVVYDFMVKRKICDAPVK
mgnify:CR=1 FL=1